MRTPDPASGDDPGVRIWQLRDWVRPVPPVRREVHRAVPAVNDAPPLLFVHDAADRGGARVFVDPWLARAAERGHLAAAVSLRGRGGTERPGRRFGVRLREWVHDVVQEAAALPRRAVLIGQGTGALVVAHALLRYPAEAAVLIAPSGLTGSRLDGLALLPRAPRLGIAAALLPAPAVPPVTPPMLVAADRKYPAKALDRLAVRYRAQSGRLPVPSDPLTARTEPLDAILDWLAAAGQR